MSRRDRLNEELRQQISLILQKDIHNPGIGFITITKVDISPDLRSADIFFTTMDDTDTTFTALKQSAGQIRSLLGKRIRIKFIPRITFINDDSARVKNRVDEILDIIHKGEEKADGN